MASKEQMDLNWQDNLTSPETRLKYLYDNQVITDCEFLVGEEKRRFKAHKFVLAMSSSVFHCQFNGNLADKEQMLIEDIEPEIFEKLLKYIYLNELDEFNAVEEAKKLTYVAKKYLIKDLVTKCGEFIKGSLNDDNACELYEFAQKFDDHILAEKSLEYIKKRAHIVLENDSFEKIHIDTLLTILKQDDLNISSEMELFNALEKYAKNRKLLRKESISLNTTTTECQIRRDFIEKLCYIEEELKLREAVRMIRFLTMSVNEFTEGPAHSQLLTPKERLLLLRRIAAPDDVRNKVPEGFNDSSDKRS